MTKIDRWTKIRGLLPAPGQAEPAQLDPLDRSRLWMLLGAYDRTQGRDEVTGDPVTLDAAVVVVGGMSATRLVSAATWANRRADAIALVGPPLLSTINGRELGDRLAALAPPVPSAP